MLHVFGFLEIALLQGIPKGQKTHDKFLLVPNSKQEKQCTGQLQVQSPRIVCFGGLIPGQYHQPPIPHTGGHDGTKGDILPQMPYTWPEMPYTCVHRQTIWTNCPRPAPLATNNPYRGGGMMGLGTKGGHLLQVGIYDPKINLALPLSALP